MKYRVKVQNVRTEAEVREVFDLESPSARWYFGRLVGKAIGKVWDGTTKDEFVVRVSKA